MSKAKAPKVHYRICDRLRPQARIEVEMTIEGCSFPARLVMASWSPGSYLIRDYARFVSRVSVRDKEGHEVEVIKVGKGEWVIGNAKTAGSVCVRYEVYGNDLGVRTNHFDDTHAFVHGPATWLFVAGQQRSSTIAIDSELTPVISALAESGGGFRAEDVDQLLDSPIHLGEVHRQSFAVNGTPHQLAVWGMPEHAVFSASKLAEDLGEICAGHAARFQSTGEAEAMPFARYSFLLMLSPAGYGGLEHADCSVSLHSPQAFFEAERYRDLLELLSHEYLHAWNGKRLRPASFGVFDYQRENYTRCLWMVEGVTSYLDRLQLVRAKRLTVHQYAHKLLEDWNRLQEIPGRRVHSLEEASFDAWIKLYKPDENNLNTTISYYLLGGLAMLCLDLELRSRGQDLDQVLRELWHRYRSVGYPESLEEVFCEAAGLDLSDFFRRHIRGREELDLPGALAHVGLELSADDTKRGRPWLGVVLRGSSTVRAVVDGSPAAQAGVSPGDEVLALDGQKCHGEAALRGRLAHLPADSQCELTVFRRQMLRTLPVRLQPAPLHRFRIRLVEGADAQVRRRFSEWLLAEWPPAGGAPILARSHKVSWT